MSKTRGPVFPHGLPLSPLCARHNAPGNSSGRRVIGAEHPGSLTKSPASIHPSLARTSVLVALLLGLLVAKTVEGVPGPGRLVHRTDGERSVRKRVT